MKPLTQEESNEIIRATLRAFNEAYMAVRPVVVGVPDNGGNAPEDIAALRISQAIRSMERAEP